MNEHLDLNGICKICDFEADNRLLITNLSLFQCTYLATNDYLAHFAPDFINIHGFFIEISAVNDIRIIGFLLETALEATFFKALLRFIKGCRFLRCLGILCRCRLLLCCRCLLYRLYFTLIGIIGGHRYSVCNIGYNLLNLQFIFFTVFALCCFPIVHMEFHTETTSFIQNLIQNTNQFIFLGFGYYTVFQNEFHCLFIRVFHICLPKHCIQHMFCIF